MLVKQETFVEPPDGTRYVFVKYILPIVDSNMNDLESLGGVVHRVFKWLNVVAVLVPEEAAVMLGRFPEIEYVEEVGTMHALYGDAGYKWNMQMIKSSPVHLYNTGKGVKVCIVDTGVESDHPEIVGNYKGGRGFTNDADPDPGVDVEGHGTHCAGVVAANGYSIVGVAPEASLYSCRVLTAEGGSWAWFVDAMEWCIANGMQVLSMSLGGTASSTVHSAVRQAYSAGICLVAAAGNEAQDVKYSQPASYGETIAVSACTSSKEFAAKWPPGYSGGSNWGNGIDFIAPGVWIYSAWKDGGYNTILGTSMACPHVAGLAVLIKANNPALSPDQIKNQIILHAEDLGTTGHDKYYGWGLIDVEKSVPQSLIEDPPEPPEPPEPPLPPIEWRPSNLRPLATGLIMDPSGGISVSQQPRVAGQLIVDGDNIKSPIELSHYASLVERGDGIMRKEVIEPPPQICYGLFYHTEDKSIWIGRRKGAKGSKKGFKFVDTQPILLEREEEAPEWKLMTDKEKWMEVYVRKLRHNNISIMKRGARDIAFWCTKREVKTTRLERLKTLKKTKRKEEGEKAEEKQMLFGEELLVYKLLNMPDNDQEDRLTFYKDNHIPIEFGWDASGKAYLKRVHPLYWMPVGIVVKKPEAWVAEYRIDDNKRWKYIALVEEIGVRPSSDSGVYTNPSGELQGGNFDDQYFDVGLRQGAFDSNHRYCNSELSLYGCTGLNFKDDWKWLTLLNAYPYVSLTSPWRGASAGAERIFSGYSWFGATLYHWPFKDYHPGDGMIQESVAMDKEEGGCYLYTMFGENLQIEQEDEREVSSPTSWISGKYKDWAGGVLYKIDEYKIVGIVITDYIKKGKFRVYSYEMRDPPPSKKEKEEGVDKHEDITEKLRILGIHWSEERMRVHSELKNQLKEGW